MGKAFQCDLCRSLQEGDPVTTVEVKGANGKEDWCDDCMVSYQDWRSAMRPQMDTPEAGDPPFPDAPPIQGHYQ